MYRTVLTIGLALNVVGFASYLAGCRPAAPPTPRVIVVDKGETVDIDPPDILVIRGLSESECDQYGGIYLAFGDCYGVNY